MKANYNGYQKTILELDIESCFDDIDHNKLMSLVTLPGVAKKFLRSALEAGVLKEREKTLRGTPKREVISTLLCNIALYGIEDLHNEWAYRNWFQQGLRYADDMIFILKLGEDGEALLEKVKNFLEKRGFKANKSKTRLVKATDGFDFLGWHFLVKAKNKKFVCYLSKKNHKQMVNNIKTTIRDSRYKLRDRLKMVKIIYRGWWNYHQYS